MDFQYQQLILLSIKLSYSTTETKYEICKKYNEIMIYFYQK